MQRRLSERIDLYVHGGGNLLLRAASDALRSESGASVRRVLCRHDQEDVSEQSADRQMRMPRRRASVQQEPLSAMRR